MKLALTGSSGFVGNELLNTLGSYDVNIIGRTKPRLLLNNMFYKAEINSEENYLPALADVNVLIHCAARAHIMEDNIVDPLAEYRAINTAGTLNLAKQAAKMGVKRFIFISSIKVNGESTSLNSPFRSGDDLAPRDPYGISKFEAEVGLKKISEETGMEVVIIRPPLIYGSGVKGNFALMLKLCATSIPLPFPSIKDNLRSLVSVENLVSLIIICIDHPAAANQVFLVSDDNDVSTAIIFKQLRKSLGKRTVMIPIPAHFFKWAGKLIGKSIFVERLCGSLQVDIRETKLLLNWRPVITFENALDKVADEYLLNKNK